MTAGNGMPAPTIPADLDPARLLFQEALGRAAAAGIAQEVMLWGAAVELIDRIAARYGAPVAAGLLRQLADSVALDGRPPTH